MSKQYNSYTEEFKKTIVALYESGKKYRKLKRKNNRKIYTQIYRRKFCHELRNRYFSLDYAYYLLPFFHYDILTIK